MEKELNEVIDRLESLLEDQEHMFKVMFMAGFNSKVEEPYKAWLKYIREESTYSIENI